MQRTAILLPKTARQQKRKTDDPEAIVGYAAVWWNGSPDTEFRSGNFVERFQPGAFAKALLERKDIIATFNHDTARILGRTSQGSLRIEEDNFGLRFSIPFQPDDEDHQLVVGKIRSELIVGASLGFQPHPGGEQMEHSRGEQIRTIRSANLFEVGPVSMPCYAAALVMLRMPKEKIGVQLVPTC